MIVNHLPQGSEIDIIEFFGCYERNKITGATYNGSNVAQESQIVPVKRYFAKNGTETIRVSLRYKKTSSAQDTISNSDSFPIQGGHCYTYSSSSGKETYGGTTYLYGRVQVYEDGTLIKTITTRTASFYNDSLKTVSYTHSYVQE